MVAGVKIYNDAGTVQIDESYANFVLLSKQTFTISTPVTTPFDFTVLGDVTCIAVRCYPETFTATTASYSAGVWKFRLTFFNNPQTTGSCTFTVYAFGKPPMPTENVGLKVLDAAGNVVFHSQFKPLRIIGVSNSQNSFAGPPGRVTAVLVLSMAMYGYSLFPGTATDTYSFRINGTVIETARTLIASIGNPLLSRAGLYAVVDVTNY